MAKNTCECPNPPGGRVQCEFHQLAICRVKDGVIQTECIDPPAKLSTSARDAWAFGTITGIKRSLTRRLTSQEHQILLQGVYNDTQTGETVSFRLPKP